MVNCRETLSMKKLITPLILILVLVIFPLGSWYYLKKGTEYRKELLNSLEDHGKLASFALPNFKGDTITDQDFSKAILVMSKFENEAQIKETAPILNKLHWQFNDRNDVSFVSFIADDSLLQNVIMANISEEMLNDTKQVQFVIDDSGYSDKFFQGFDNTISMADTSHLVRRFYKVSDEDEIKRCVEHIAILIPMVDKRKARRPKLNIKHDN